MSKVMRAICPGCHRKLHIPEEWLNQSVRCRYCGAVASVMLKTSRATAKPAQFDPVEPKAGSAVETRDRVPVGDLTLEDGPPAAGVSQGIQAVPAWPTGADSEPIIRTSYNGQMQRPRWGVLLTVAIALGLAAVGGYVLWRSSPRQETNPQQVSNQNRTTPAAVSDDFPRRLLGICVHNHLYANAVSYGQAGENFHDLLERMVHSLHIPPDQATELSDGATAQPKPMRPPSAGRKKGARQTLPSLPSRSVILTKPVLETSIEGFLGTSRAQDRVILLFTGHVVEIGDEAFLVPLDGELNRKESLVPMSWLWERLGKCLARQKVLILETCRLDPGRGLERPGSGPMGKGLDALIAAPPAGVQIWASCSLGQFSYELEGNSIFLKCLFDALNASAMKQQPQESLPIREIAEHANPRTTRQAELSWKAKQTPRLTGDESADGAAYDPEEPAPPRWEVATSAPPGGAANPIEVRDIIQEISLPPIRLVPGEGPPLHIDALVPFSAKTLEPYKADYRSLKEIEDHPEKYPLRTAVLNTIKVIEKDFSAESDAFSLQESFAGGNDEKLKGDVLKLQTKPALIDQHLTEALTNLELAGQERSKEKSKRWQAHYDFVHADLLGRIAHVYEYNLMLGRVRAGSMPIPEGGMPSGWRMASQEKMQGGREMRERLAESRKILDRLAKQYAGTPWEVLAKRARLTALGLKWEPIYQ
jgi:hypothetical protein